MAAILDFQNGRHKRRIFGYICFKLTYKLDLKIINLFLDPRNLLVVFSSLYSRHVIHFQSIITRIVDLKTKMFVTTVFLLQLNTY